MKTGGSSSTNCPIQSKWLQKEINRKDKKQERLKEVEPDTFTKCIISSHHIVFSYIASTTPRKDYGGQRKEKEKPHVKTTRLRRKKKERLHMII